MKSCSCPYVRLLLFFLLLLGGSFTLEGQYFGKNKPRYRDFDFRILETPHFKIYHYLQNREALLRIADWSERWYAVHQAVFRDTFYTKNPLILYNHHGDFQQTNVIFGRVDIGTGGVTEAFQNRMVIPIAHTHAQTHHVIGHELVHAFQYHLILRNDSAGLESLRNLPLFMVEGLAEYLSKGKTDPMTAMWLRDAVLHDDIPDFDDLVKPKYFPYRWGHAFWTFITGMFGDQVIRPLFEMTALYGLKNAVDSLFHVRMDTLSSVWKRSLRKYYSAYIGDGAERSWGKPLITDKNGGRINVIPSLSPNGRYLIFASERDVLDIDLYLADARTGKVLRKITSFGRRGHHDALSYIESTGTWSPDGKKYAFVVYKRGRSVIVVKDVRTGKTLDEFSFEEVPSITNPAWAPRGHSIVFSGMREGQVDLYLFDMKKRTLRQLTDDLASDIHPQWSPDGEFIVFATDAANLQRFDDKRQFRFDIALYNLQTGQRRILNLFPGANNLNPVFDHRGDILFLSDRDGYRNLYRYERATGQIFQLTDFLTGISGFTPYTTAVSAARHRDRIVFSHFVGHRYWIRQARQSELLYKPITTPTVSQDAAQLPFANANKDFVDHYIQRQFHLPPLDTSQIAFKRYRPKLKLDYITGAAGAGIYTGYGATTPLAGGGLFLLFSDPLGDHKIFTNIGLQGEIYDASGSLYYFNYKRRLGWGVGFSHYPYTTGYYTAYFNRRTAADGTVLNTYEERLDILRIFFDDITLTAQYPLSIFKRWEATVGYSYQFFRWDTIVNIYTSDGLYYLGQRRGKLDIEGDEILFNSFRIRREGYIHTGVAYVGDASYFGIASPLAGYRYRFGLTTNFLGRNYQLWLADYRRYWWRRPIALAFRVYHLALTGRDAERFYPLYLGQWGFLRGLPYLSDPNRRDAILQQYGLQFENLIGNKVLLTSVELRLPFTGPDRLALIPFRYLWSELAAFVDGGVAFFQYGDLGNDEIPMPYQPKWVFTSGLSWRVVLFRSIVIEPYLSWILHKNSRPLFGLTLVPGW